MDEILDDTYKQILNHRRRAPVFEAFCRLIYKGKHGKDPEAGQKASYLLGIDEDCIVSRTEERTVEELDGIKNRMIASHDRVRPYHPGIANAIVVVEFENVERILDGSNRINYWVSEGDLSKLLKINHHTVTARKKKA